MAPFLDLSRLSFEIWKAPYLLDVRLAPFFGPLAHAPSDVVLDQGNDWIKTPTTNEGALLHSQNIVFIKYNYC